MFKFNGWRLAAYCCGGAVLSVNFRLDQFMEPKWIATIVLLSFAAALFEKAKEVEINEQNSDSADAS